jgi:hypothetical protein
MNDRTPPNDNEAERSAIHTCLHLGRIPEPLQSLRPTDFYRPDHETIWRAIGHLVSNRQPCDAVAVRACLIEAGDHRITNQMLELITGPLQGDPANLAAIILDRAGRRHLIEAMTRMGQRAYESDEPYEEILRQAEAELAKVPTTDTGNVDSLLTAAEFLGRDVPEPQWVIPQLIARGERLILTGTEGFGKSTMLRQLAMCGAAGIEPFIGHSCPPVTVLLIDAENPLWIMQKRFRELRQAVNSHGGVIEHGRFWIDRRPEGLNLGSPADRRWLQKRIVATNPDLIVIGPAYKLHDAGNEDKDETIARTVTGVLDDLRGDAALVLEHHAGNEQAGGARPVRPFGSSLWRRWPEFGYGIRPAKHPDAETKRIADLVPWRGARDERRWPRQMASGGDGLPWVEYFGELRAVQ